MAAASSSTARLSKSTLFGATELDHLIEGAAFLGAGGGGTLAVAHEFKRVILEVTNGEGVHVVPIANVRSSETAAVAADVGASNTYVTHQEVATTNAFVRLAELVLGQGKLFDYVLPAEVGAENSLAAVVVAAKLGLPVIDADGSRRAIPTLPLSLYARNEASSNPTVIANVAGECAVLYAPNAKKIEALLSPSVAAPAFANSAGMALWNLTGADIRRVTIPGTLNLARTVGATLARARAKGEDPVRAVLSIPSLQGVLLARGSVVKANQDVSGTFDVGSVVVKESSGEELIIFNKNENMMAWRTGEPAPVATAPDSICFVTPDGHALSNAEVTASTPKRKSELCVVGLLAHPKLRTKKMVPHYESELRTMGYGGSYVSLESLVS